VDDFMWISPLWIPIIAIVGGITLAIVKSISWARVRELEVRERIAMIEKGLIPPPETNPRGFERAMEVVDRMEQRRQWYDDPYYSRWHEGARARHRRAGVTLTFIGFGLIFMLGMLAEPRVGIAVGGFLILLGVAFFINSLFERSEPSRSAPSWQPPYPPSAPPPVPPNHDPNRPRS
jgi:hypothetical protein